MLWTDLRELKAVLEIDPRNTNEDKKLGFFIEYATAWIEELLNRDFSFKSRTQYYCGTGTQQLLLRNRPVNPTPPAPYSAISVVVDENGNFGQTSGAFTGPTSLPLVLGTDYVLVIDEDNGTSRSGILKRINDYWNKPFVRQTGLLSPFVGEDTGSIQVTYTAGFTVDTLPSSLRLACNLLVAKMRYVFPLGIELGSENYEDRSISALMEKKDYLISLVAPLIMTHRNWRF